MVILVIGILASVAIASYLSQANKGQDLAAKSQVRSLQGQVEACATENDDNYSDCDTAAELGDALNGIEFVDPTATPGPGKVTVVRGRPPTTYTIKAGSKSGHEFTIERKADGSGRAHLRGQGQGRLPRRPAATGVW